jgi:Uma2 family endonuclease
MQTPIPTRRYTPEEYLELEKHADYKSEYQDGEIIPMTGGTTDHNKIAGTFYAFLKFALRGKGYELYIGDVRLWIPRHKRYTYPDVMVIQGQPVYEGKGTTTVTNPLLIAEVLSPSTQNYDQGDKFTCYRSIPSFQEYILIDQKRFHVIQHCKREDGKWLLTEYEGENAVISLSRIEFEISLSDLYEGVNFTVEEE